MKEPGKEAATLDGAPLFLVASHLSRTTHSKAKVNAMFTKKRANPDIRYFVARLIAPILPILVCGLMGIVLSPTGTAQAQNAVQPDIPRVIVEGAPSPTTNLVGVTTAPWRSHFGEHAADVLRASGPQAKQEAMQDLIAVTANGSKIDLTGTLSELLEVVEHGASEESRLMALQTLHVIGIEHSDEGDYRETMRKLYRIAQEESSERVRGAAADLLSDYYGTEDG